MFGCDTINTIKIIFLLNYGLNWVLIIDDLLEGTKMQQSIIKRIGWWHPILLTTTIKLSMLFMYLDDVECLIVYDSL